MTILIIASEVINFLTNEKIVYEWYNLSDKLKVLIGNRFLTVSLALVYERFVLLFCNYSMTSIAVYHEVFVRIDYVVVRLQILHAIIRLCCIFVTCVSF